MEITKLQSPFHLILFEDRQITENLYGNAIPEPFVEEINAAIRSHLFTRANENGLIHYFSCNDEAYEEYVKAHVQYAHPRVEVADGSLRLVIEIGSDCRLPENIIDAIIDNMEHQCKTGWGQEIENVDIFLRDVVLYEPDSSIGLRSEMELLHPDYHFHALINPSLSIYVYNAEWTELRESKKETEIFALQEESSVLKKIQSKKPSRYKQDEPIKKDYKNHNRKNKKNKGER